MDQLCVFSLVMPYIEGKKTLVFLAWCDEDGGSVSFEICHTKVYLVT